MMIFDMRANAVSSLGKKFTQIERRKEGSIDTDETYKRKNDFTFLREIQM
jgi:hypothetical protein